MIRRVQVLPIASRELREARRYYERQRHGLGLELVADFERVTIRIGQNAEAFQVVRGDVRHALLKKFSYTVFYRISGSRAVITGFMHSHRDSAEWLSR